jgi:hypothetical protein
VGASGSIWVDKMCYGIGQVDYVGGFTTNGSTATIVHGKGYTVSRAAAGTFLVKVTTPFKTMLTSAADLVAPAAQGNTFTHPGFAVTGDLQSDGQTFDVYTYNFAGTQGDPASTVLIEFAITLSNSLNTP